MAEAREVTGLKVVTEVTEVEAVDAVAHYADILQIGARNMQNFRLLKEVGRCNKPVAQAGDNPLLYRLILKRAEKENTEI